MTDWSRTEKIERDVLTVSYSSEGSTERKTQALTSTTRSITVSNYQKIAYIDVDGNNKEQEVEISNVETKTTTNAAVNPDWVVARLSFNAGLPSGADTQTTTKRTEYRATSEGAVKVREITEVRISFVAFAGQLSGIPYARRGANGSLQLIAPPGGSTISSLTEVTYEYSKTSDGREMTKEVTSRSIAAGLTSEGKSAFARDMQKFKSLINQAALNAAIYGYTGLLFQGAEVQIITGRAPVAAKPSDQELTGDEIANGKEEFSFTTPEERYGNNSGWTAYVPPGEDWKEARKDSDNDGLPDWTNYIPTTPDFYDNDTSGDGVPDWADFVPVYPDQLSTSIFVEESTVINRPSDWNDYDKDSDGDGAPDWERFVPSEILATAPFIVEMPFPENYAPTDGEFVGTAPYIFDTDFPDNYPPPRVLPDDWDRDSSGNGVPDWSDFVPVYPDQISTTVFIEDTRILDLPSSPSDWNDYTDDDKWEDYVPTDVDDFDTSDTDYDNPDAQPNNERSVTGVVIFDDQRFTANDPTVTATYDMPFAPDDNFEFDKKVRKLRRNGATEAAIAFGQTEVALDIGHAFGQNIVTSFERVPTLDMSPVYVRLAGIEGAFLMDGVSYAWSSEGMVVSADLMLVGVTGYYGATAPTGSWLQLPVQPTTIRQIAEEEG